MNFKNVKTRMLSGFMAAAMTIMSLPAATASAGQTLTLNGGGQRKDTYDGYTYELWIDNTGGSGSMTLNDGGAFDTEWSCEVRAGNFLARRGRDFDRTKKATDVGTITLDYDATYTAGSAGNSRLCVYGWMVDPLAEYYIIEDYVNWCPGPDPSTFQSKTVTIDDAQYEIFWIWHEGPTIEGGGNKKFKQYFSIRKSKRTSGRITVSDHFKAWEEAGLEIGNLTEVALNVEGWESSGRANVTKNVITVGSIPDPVPTEPPTQPEPDADGYYFHSTFEGGTDKWSGRGDASVVASSNYAAAGTQALSVKGRTDTWNGASLSLDTKTFVPGTAYSFSAMAMQKAAASDHFKLTLQYVDSNNKEQYSTIAEADAARGEWVQLANTSYTIPAGASNLLLYVETEDSKNDFWIDEAIGAPEGTVIDPAIGPSNLDSRGDVNGNGKVELLDIVALQKFLVNIKVDIQSSYADMNGDNKLDIFDLAILKRFVLDESFRNNQLKDKVDPPLTTDPETTEAPQQKVEGQWYNTADVSWIDKSKPMVALAFDDGPIAGSNCPARIQDAIANNGGHSTFFYWGERIAGNEAEIKRAQSLGHEIANHTWSHPDMTTLSEAQMIEEINKCKSALTAITGQEEFLIRPPFLKTNETFQRVAGVPLVNCSVYSMDWEKASKDQIKQTILNAMNDGSLNGAVVLMHENYDTTAGAIEELAPVLKANGWQMVTVSEMFKAAGQTMYNGQVYNRLG